MASAAWTRQATRVLHSTSLWCAWMAWMMSSFSRYFRQNSTPRATWVPSISWSTALPISCSRPARLAACTSAPSSAAMRPAMWLTSMECCSTFWP